MHWTVVTPSTMLQTVLLSPLVVGAPQYGGGTSGGHSAPSQAQTSVQCRTESQVVWDTKYVQTETQVSRILVTSRHVR